jgi:hypothetical protein
LNLIADGGWEPASTSTGCEPFGAGCDPIRKWRV